MNPTRKTYRAVQVSSPGKFEYVERPLVEIRLPAESVSESKPAESVIPIPPP
jgi:hypothetical protein